MGVGEAFACLLIVFLGGMVFEVFTVFVGLLVEYGGQQENESKSNDDSLEDDGFIYAAMYLSMNDE